MLDRGEDPQQAVIDRGHELNLHVYASLRMNDNHFNGAQPSDLQTLHHVELTKLRKDHPEWLLGADTEEWFALSWNMAIPQVRENRFQHLREVCQNYPWDGVELDWQRHPFHFPADYAYRLRYIFTDFMRAARQMTDELAQERGRPFYLAARVAGSIEGCHRIGYDVETWAKENLVDILIPAGAAGTDPAIEVSAFRALCADRDIALYPGFDGGVPGPAAGPERRNSPPQHAHQSHGHAVSRPRRNRYIRLQLARRPRFKARVANPSGRGTNLCAAKTSYTTPPTASASTPGSGAARTSTTGCAAPYPFPSTRPCGRPAPISTSISPTT